MVEMSYLAFGIMLLPLVVSLAFNWFQWKCSETDEERMKAFSTRTFNLSEEVAELTVERNHLKHQRDTNAKIIEQFKETNDELKAKLSRFYEDKPLYEVKLVISKESSISFLDAPKLPPLNLIDLSKPIKPPPAKEKHLRLSLYIGTVILQEDNLLYDQEELKEKCAVLMSQYLADTYPHYIRKEKA